MRIVYLRAGRVVPKWSPTTHFGALTTKITLPAVDLYGVIVAGDNRAAFAALTMITRELQFGRLRPLRRQGPRSVVTAVPQAAAVGPH